MMLWWRFNLLPTWCHHIVLYIIQYTRYRYLFLTFCCNSTTLCPIHPPIEPKFVGSAIIPDNEDRDDDKVYFFFTEREMNAEGANKALYTRVGRVCAVRMQMLYQHLSVKCSQSKNSDSEVTIYIRLNLSERPRRAEDASEQVELVPEDSSHLLCGRAKWHWHSLWWTRYSTVCLQEHVFIAHG